MYVSESEIFYGFCSQFSSMGISVNPTPSTWKYRVYYYFDLLGRMLGYEVYTEDTFKEADGITELVHKRIDMTWVSEETKEEYALALEYEKTKEIDDEITKLSNISGLRVLVIFRYNFANREIIEKVKEQMEKYGPQSSNFLIFMLPNTFQRKEPLEKITALLLDSQGKIRGFGTAEGYVGEDGICSFKRIMWHEKNDENDILNY